VLIIAEMPAGTSPMRGLFGKPNKRIDVCGAGVMQVAHGIVRIEAHLCIAFCANYTQVAPFPPTSTTRTAFEQETHKIPVYFPCVDF
jgi:hypothetical protein